MIYGQKQYLDSEILLSAYGGKKHWSCNVFAFVIQAWCCWEEKKQLLLMHLSLLFEDGICYWQSARCYGKTPLIYCVLCLGKLMAGCGEGTMTGARWLCLCFPDPSTLKNSPGASYAWGYLLTLLLQQWQILWKCIDAICICKKAQPVNLTIPALELLRV